MRGMHTFVRDVKTRKHGLGHGVDLESPILQHSLKLPYSPSSIWPLINLPEIDLRYLTSLIQSRIGTTL